VKIGVSIFFQNEPGGVPDEKFVKSQLELALLAEELGYDYVSFPEHHFEEYSMMPDNIQALSWVAARTEKIKLFPGVTVLPWHDPLRVAERLILLDHLSDGRVMVGFGRGLAQLEYDAFRIDMNESRQRFDEAVVLVANALETGVMEGGGPFYPQPRVEIRPRPTAGFADRLWVGAGSADTVHAVASVGGRLMNPSSQPLEKYVTLVDAYREAYRTQRGTTTPPPPLFADFVYCHEDPAVAEETFLRYAETAFVLERDHYFGKAADALSQQSIKGYEQYKAMADRIRTQTPASGARAKQDIMATGSPEQILDRYRARVEAVGMPVDCLLVTSFGGMPPELSAQSMRTYADQIIPELRKIAAGPVAAS
jgi:alkanesulfonate monooxygenase SsuD/methylene tetrahydromethanopterin reductase-like flavin-dependent oxidoreductase (luciferase family)